MLKFLPVLLLGALALCGCDPTETPSDSPAEIPSAPAAPVAANVKLSHTDLPAHTVFRTADSLTGDFNGDGLLDQLEVIETEVETDFGKERGLVAYSVVEGERRNWYYAPGAVLSSKNGGMMGDPFQDLRVYPGTLRVRFDYAGGSRLKWAYTHIWRWDTAADDFILTSLSAERGDPCGETEEMSLDYNDGEDEDVVGLGVMSYDCETGEEFGDWIPVGMPMPARPSMRTFSIGDNELALKGQDLTFNY